MNKVIFKVEKKVVGEYSPTTATFYKRAKPNHMLRTPLGWAVDKHVVDALAHMGCKWIMIDTPDGRYTVEFQDFILHCFELDRGYGNQYALTMANWKFTKKEQ